MRCHRVFFITLQLHCPHRPRRGLRIVASDCSPCSSLYFRFVSPHSCHRVLRHLLCRRFSAHMPIPSSYVHSGLSVIFRIHGEDMCTLDMIRVMHFSNRLYSLQLLATENPSPAHA